MSFIRFGGWGNVFKSFRPTSKKTFSNNIKGPQPTARFRQKFYHDSLLNYTDGTSNFATDYMYFSEFILTNRNYENIDITIVFFLNCNLFATITDSYFQLK